MGAHTCIEVLLKEQQMLRKLVSFNMYIHFTLKLNMRFLDQRKLLFPKAINTSVPPSLIFPSFGWIQWKSDEQLYAQKRVCITGEEDQNLSMAVSTCCTSPFLRERDIFLLYYRQILLGKKRKTLLGSYLLKCK